VEANQRYDRSLVKAQLLDLLGLISGEDRDLVRFDEVAKRVKARQRIEMGTQMVQLDDIVGSVGRYRDFTRTYLPRAGVNKDRWVRVDAALNSMVGVPPVELLKIGDAFFVRDGNHRVSVARANGLTHIEAYVTEVQTDIPFTADDFERDRWIIKVEHAEFMEWTGLDRLRPGHELRFTEPGRYEILARHIEVHRYLHNEDLAREGSGPILSWEDGVESWYDNIYMPVIQAIRKYGLMEQFPNRTEADLYLWIAHHREGLARTYGLAPLSAEAAVATFAQSHSDKPLEKTVKGLRLGIHRALGHEEPLGMTQAEYQNARDRHDAGEISLSEAEEKEHGDEATEAS
jgi:hypothetical protein